MGYGQYTSATYGNALAKTPREYEAQRKTVFGSHAQLAHVWAQQRYAYGRSSDGRMFFEGATIFSYRSSWPVARFVTNKRGQTAVLVRDHSCSTSTSKHTGLARSAIDAATPIFAVTDPSAYPDSTETKAYFKCKLEEAIAAAARAKSKADWHMRYAEKTAHTANDMSEFFGWRWRLPVPAWSPEFIAEAKNRAAEASRARAEKTRLENKKRNAALKEKIDLWLAGETLQFPWGYAGPILLRVKDEEIETSKGAKVPVDHAKRLWPHIARCRNGKTAWQSDGHKLLVGHFRVDRIEANGDIKAGCHHIPYAELARIASALGVA